MHHLRRTGVSCILAWLVVLGSQAGWCATLYVSPSGNATPPYDTWTTAATDIGTAVGYAFAGDEVIVGDGVYIIPSTINVWSGIRIRSLNGYASTTVDGVPSGVTCFYLDDPGAVLEGFTLSGTIAGAGQGGGVYIGNFGGTVRDCTLFFCSAGVGGGLFALQNARVENCRFILNQASSGGAIYAGPGSMISNCFVSENVASMAGGGLYLVNATEVYRCVITNNVATSRGGGIYCEGQDSLIEGCVITDNVASNWYGGGVYFHAANILRNSTVIFNRAGQNGGGVHCTNSSIDSCTFVNNSSINGGGGLHTLGPCQIWNTILLWNSATVGEGNHNDDPNANFIGCDTTPIPATGHGNFTADPLFVDPGSDNYRLTSSSPCIDYNAWIGGVPSRDPDGVLRPQDGNRDGLALYDVGAYEYAPPRRTTANDYNGDGRSDFPVFNPPDGAWYVRRVDGPVITWQNSFGWDTAVPVIGDYNGDRKWDLAVFDTAGGYWYVKGVSGPVIMWSQQWGWSTAKPVPGDYDGDGRWDMAVFDTAGGYWYIRKVSGPVITWANQWGWSTAKPVPGDYDGDGKWDLAVFDTVGGYWYIKKASGPVITWANQWGWSTAKPVPGDYDGDGKWDLAVFDTVGGYWYIKKASGPVITWGKQWGWSTAKPVPGDYDGDGKYDLAVYDMATGLWYVKSLDGRILAWESQWGWPGAVIPALEPVQ